MSEQASPPAWLFSFVDLAFLLLIAMTQLASNAAQAPNLGEIIVPPIDVAATSDLPATASDDWQLRIYPRPTATEDGSNPKPPFELNHDGASAAALRLTSSELAERLDEILEVEAGRPLLAPHEDSRSGDLLDAVALLEDRWPSARNRRRAALTRIAAR